jgi:hypothetical protein
MTNHRSNESLSVSWTECDDAPPKGVHLRTACGGIVEASDDTPCVKLPDGPVYFCLPICKSDFEKDPGCSCLAVGL